MLILVLWLALGEMLAAGALGRRRRPERPRLGHGRQSLAGGPCGLAALHAVDPGAGMARPPINLFLLVAAVLTVLLNGLAVVRIRAWNASGQDDAVKRPEVEGGRRGEGEKGRKGDLRVPPSPFLPDPRCPFPSAHRAVWDNPVLGAKSAPGPMDGRSLSCD